MGQWADLLPELLTSIARRIDPFEDFIAFSGVCRSWRSVAVNDKLYRSAPSKDLIPWLMLAEDGEDRGFASLRKEGMVLRVDLPEASGKRCISSMGWLVTADEQGNAELLHPLSRVRIHLPHPTTNKSVGGSGGDDEWLSPKSLIRRAVLSASPSVTQDYILMILIGSLYYPAFWKPGNSMWTLIQPESATSVCLDVIYYKDQFYAMNIEGKLLLCNLNSDTASVVGGGAISALVKPDGETYLVESGSNLLVVCRGRQSRYNVRYRTGYFRVFKFHSRDLNKWEEIHYLGEVTIFVGQSAAKAVVPSASCSGIKPNCIYFTDDYEGEGCGDDLGIYDLASITVEPLPIITTRSSLQSLHGLSLQSLRWIINSCQPLWVFPSF